VLAPTAAAEEVVVEDRFDLADTKNYEFQRFDLIVDAEKELQRLIKTQK